VAYLVGISPDILRLVRNVGECAAVAPFSNQLVDLETDKERGNLKDEGRN